MASTKHNRKQSRELWTFPGEGQKDYFTKTMTFEVE